jgi:RNA polymerase sigma-70 factor (ECF subfamily)
MDINGSVELIAKIEDPAAVLLRGIAARDQAALAKLHALMGRRIHAFSVRLTHDPDLANEVVSDTLLDVWRYPERFNGQSKVGTWILAIAKYKTMHALRQRRRPHVDIDDMADSLISEMGDPESTKLANERARELRKCIQRLPEEQRECLHMVYFEDLTLAEVAEFQGVPENTVKTRLFHARKKLEVYLAGVLD